MGKQALRWFRYISMAEGISFVLLLAVAMPLKYAADFPAAVTVNGWAHGLLFVLYFAALAVTAFLHRWSLLRIAGAAVSAFLPLAPFFLEARLRREERGM